MQKWMLLLPALLAACERGEDSAGVNLDSNQIERLATPKEAEPDLQVSARLQSLDDRELVGSANEPRCRFVREGVTLLLAMGRGATARVEGRVRQFELAAPVGPTGGFFENRELSISVGRTGEEESAVGDDQGWPARIATTNRVTKAQTELGGRWLCERR